MMIGFFVNDLEREYENYTTTVLAHQATSRGHRVCYITPYDFVLNADDTLSVHARFLPKRKYKDRPEFFKTLVGVCTSRTSDRSRQRTWSSRPGAHDRPR